MKSNFNLRKYLILLGDIVALYFSLWLTLIIRYQTNNVSDLLKSHAFPFTVVIIAILVIFYINDLYEITIGKSRLEILGKLIQSAIFSSIFAFAFFYLGSDRLFTIRPQKVFLIYIIAATFLVYLWRLSFSKIAKSEKIANQILIIGYDQLTKKIIETIDKNLSLGFRIQKIIIDEQTTVDETIKNHKIITGFSNLDQLKEICLADDIKAIIYTTNPRDNKQLATNLFDCLPLKINFLEATYFFEKLTGRIPVTTIKESWFLENLNERNKKVYDFSKRITDLTLSIILLTISLIFIPLIALIIKIDSRGPAFFKQIRTGKNGKPFLTIKFRSMTNEAEKNGPQWATKNDSRITRIGKFMRKTRIDEIPQLINVIRGEMSLIGPRPERPEFIEQLQKEIPFYKERLLIKPGLSGWAQVVGPAYGGSKEETLEKLQYDLFYIKNRSIGLDINIILKTIKTVLSVKGQ